MRQSTLFHRSVLALTILAVGAVGMARGDVFELANGGRIEGALVGDAADDANYVIATAAGGRMTLPRAQVSRVVQTPKLDAEYERLARGTADTVEAQWKLAQWCRDNKLFDQSRRHLARVIELDPDHAEARQLLGYRQVNGAWMNQDEIMAARGMIQYEGKWRTRQHVELLERQKQARAAEADWSNRLDRLRRWLTGRQHDRAAQAQAEIVAIRDPSAAEPLVNMLDREDDPDLVRLWISVLAELDHSLAVDTLVQLSLFDEDQELRVLCLEYLIKSGRPGLATPYVRALRSADNQIINRAADALGQIGDPEAMGPLIDALVTKHRFKVGPDSGGQQSHSYSFTPNGGGSFNFGGGGPKIVTQEVKNPSVLSALVLLSGGTSFDYDQEHWRAWLAAQAKLHMVDVRRDQ